MKIGNTSFLKQLINLEYLGLRETGITDINFVANMKNLRELDISRTQVKDLRVLKKLTGLKKLNVKNVRLSYEQIEFLEKELPDLEIEY